MCGELMAGLKTSQPCLSMSLRGSRESTTSSEFRGGFVVALKYSQPWLSPWPELMLGLKTNQPFSLICLRLSEDLATLFELCAGLVVGLRDSQCLFSFVSFIFWMLYYESLLWFTLT